MKKIKSISLSLLFLTVALLANASCESTNPLYQQWTIVNDDGTTSVYDFTDTAFYVAAQIYPADYCASVNNAYDPGVCYQSERYPMRVIFETKTSGRIEYQDEHIGKWYERCTFSDLTKKSVTLVFEGEYEWKLSAAKEHIDVVNPNDQELNVVDLSTIVNYHDLVPDILKRVCEGKNLKQLAKHTDPEGDESYETWGRNIQVKDGKLIKTGSDALGIHYAIGFEVSIVFSDKKLIPIYEKQLARLGYTLKATRKVETGTIRDYGSEEWSEETPAPYYIYDDGKGLYQLGMTLI